MNIQGYQKMTLLDYPTKTACTVFAGGCNLRCPFCHNADLVRRPMAVESMEGEVLAYLEKRRGLLDGVCVTGGEPLLQPDLIVFLEKLKAMGYLVKLDTNGRLPERLRTALKTGLVDYVAMDLKHTPEGYCRAVGCEVEPEHFLRSMEILQESGVFYELRTTAVKGIHKIEDFGEMARLIPQEPPYFIQCFKDSGNLLSGGCAAFSEAELRVCLAEAKKYHQNTYLRG